MLSRRVLFETPEISVARVRCDGADASEQVTSDQCVVVMHGSFAVRHRRGRAVVDPGQALLWRTGSQIDIRHPRCEGDECLAISGPLVHRFDFDAIATRPIGERAWQRLRTAEDPLALEVALCEAFAAEASARRRDRDIAAAIAYVLHERFDEPLRVSALAALADVSPFHACRAFRRATGKSIHAYLSEVRLRHALALVVETDRPLADIAFGTGFSGQPHLTRHFHRRFGIPPGRARAKYHRAR